jgi:hypothetical protein
MDSWRWSSHSEAQNVDDRTQDNRENDIDALPRISGRASPAEAKEEDRQTTGVENHADPIQFPELLVSGLVAVASRPGRGKICENRVRHRENRKDNGDIVDPAPGGFLSKLYGDEGREDGPRSADAEFSPGQARAPMISCQC